MNLRSKLSTLTIGCVIAGLASTANAITAPTDIGNLTLWLDASDGATITDAGGGAVSAWNDKSGQNHHFNQATVNARPTTGTHTQNGQNVIDFETSGGADFLQRTTAGNLPVANGDDTYTYFAVWNPDVNAVMAVYEQATAGASRRSSILAVNANYGFNGQNNDAHNLVAYSPNDWRVTDLKIDDAANPTVDIFDNDVQYTQELNGLNIGDTAAMVGRKVTGGEFFNGQIAEIIVYDRALSASERSDVRDYLDEK
jgi:hypothetical protein